MPFFQHFFFFNWTRGNFTLSGGGISCPGSCILFSPAFTHARPSDYIASPRRRWVLFVVLCVFFVSEETLTVYTTHIPFCQNFLFLFLFLLLLISYARNCVPWGACLLTLRSESCSLLFSGLTRASKRPYFRAELEVRNKKPLSLFRAAKAIISYVDGTIEPSTAHCQTAKTIQCNILTPSFVLFASFLLWRRARLTTPTTTTWDAHVNGRQHRARRQRTMATLHLFERRSKKRAWL